MGNILSSLPVKVKGEGSMIGTTTGALIVGLLGTQVCGKELIAGAKCEEIAIVYATIGGAALGYVTEALLGNHDGHQYIINVDDSDLFNFIAPRSPDDQIFVVEKGYSSSSLEDFFKNIEVINVNMFGPVNDKIRSIFSQSILWSNRSRAAARRSLGARGTPSVSG